ncbi:MAG: HAD family phosphatase [Hespellia sp.]|nr:HAD family phosphatase [Hespellia sp.]
MSASQLNGELISALKTFQIQGAVFDMDGVLLDSMPLWEHAGELYLDSLGISSPADLGQTLLEMNMQEGAVYLADHFGLEKSVPEIMDDINRLIISNYRHTVPLKDGVMELLTELKKRNIKMAVATSSDTMIAIPAFQRLQIDRYFEDILTCSQYQTSKREPFIFEKAAEIMGTKKERTLIFEDSLSAAKTAAKAGFRVAGVYDRSSADMQEELKKHSDIYMR